MRRRGRILIESSSKFKIRDSNFNQERHDPIDPNTSIRKKLRPQHLRKNKNFDLIY